MLFSRNINLWKKSNLVLRQFAAKVSLLSIWGMLVAKKNCVVRRHSEIDGKKHGFRYFSLIIKCCHYCYYYTRLLPLPSGSRILLHQGQCLSIKVNYFHIVWFDKKIPSSSKAGKKRWNYFSVQNKYKCPAKKPFSNFSSMFLNPNNFFQFEL